MSNSKVLVENTGSLQETIQTGSSLFESIEYQSLGMATGCVLFLLLIHWSFPKIRKLDIFDNSILNSIAGGLILGYVFLHILPSLIFNIGDLKEQASSHFLSDEKNLLFVIFMFVLAGFTILYTLEKIAYDHVRQNKEAGTVVYAAHIGILMYLSFSIALIMPIISQNSFSSLILFTTIMACHFILEDHSMIYNFPTRFTNIGRYIVMGGIVLGWLIGNFFTPYHYTFITTFMNAFLAGALILTTTKTEFALLEGRSHFPTFIASLSVKAAVVFIMLLLENIG